MIPEGYEAGAMLLYQCRLCGKVDGSTHAPSGWIIILHFWLNNPLPEEWLGMRPGLVTPHYCEGGRIGLSDFVGVQFDKKDAAE